MLEGTVGVRDWVLFAFLALGEGESTYFFVPLMPGQESQDGFVGFVYAEGKRGQMLRMVLKGPKKVMKR